MHANTSSIQTTLVSALRSCSILGLLAATLIGPSTARAESMTISSLTTGTSGSFAGALHGDSFTGSITSNPQSDYRFTPTGTTFDSSVTDGTSSQYSYSNVYTPGDAQSSQIGYVMQSYAGATATVTINFATAFLNPIFQIANLDASTDTFALTGGVTGLSLLSGNGGADGDGLGISGNTIMDLNNSTTDNSNEYTQPPTTGNRSAYGSVELLGEVTSITFTVNVVNTSYNDGANFSLATFNPSAVPEPSSIVLCGLAGVISSAYAWRRRKRAATV